MVSRLILALIATTVLAAAEPVDFGKQVLPVLSANCFACHGPDQEVRKAELRLDTRDGAVALRKGRAAVIPGNPEASELVRRIAATDPDDVMPPQETGRRLKPAEIAALRQWIADGAKYSRHWSFESPVRPPIPAARSPRDGEWSQGPIDRFVLEHFATATPAWQPAAAADRYTLARRASLDLTGLPPTPEQTDAFVADPAPQAYEQFVDRLLASPAFGERWARPWLDLARYADSAGYAQDPERTIWMYRDWVLDALNSGMTFDRFTLEQLAGDLLPDANTSTRIATAFHRNTQTNSEGGTDNEEFRNAAVVDRVNTTFQVWMGLTMGCAQCHTHKYDPITQEEYFKVFAIFNNSEDADREDESPVVRVLTEEQGHRRASLEAEAKSLRGRLGEGASKARERITSRRGPLATRFVRIELPGKGVYLSLAEVEVLVNADDVARGRPARQKSTAFEGPAELAVDGKTDGDYNQSRSVTHTGADDDPWWEVDLQETRHVDRLRIWNRTDSGTGSRLKGFRVVLLDEHREPLWSREAIDAPSPMVELAIPRLAEERDDAALAALERYPNFTPAELVQDRQRLEAVDKELAALQGVPTPVMQELPADKRRKTLLQLRGNFKVTGNEVPPGVPAAFHPLTAGSTPDRLAFSHWLLDARNPLTARTTINRHWQELFGRGLVETSEDFGLQGEQPSHPELLDWLAVELVESGWDVKRLLRGIVTSAVYRQSAQASPRAQTEDPDNVHLTRGPRFRLSAEAVRDQALASSGLLYHKLRGPSVRPPQPAMGMSAAFGGSTDWEPSPGGDRWRRGIYTKWRRTTPYPSMIAFDAPSREFCTVRRIPTNTPLQALITLNDPVYIEAAQALARRLVAEGGSDPATRVDRGFRLCLTRPPSPTERDRLVTLHENVLKRFRQEPDAARAMATDPLGPAPTGVDLADLAAWTVVANVLMNLDEFLMRG